jgi:hypothetical protein
MRPALYGGFALVFGILILRRKARHTGIPVKMGFVFVGKGVTNFTVFIHIFILGY